MSQPILYWMPESFPCRTVYVVAQLLGIDLELKSIDLMKKEQLSDEFVKINPFHVVPTFVDNDGFTLWESRTIAIYLIQSRKPDSPLYPSNDLKKQAIINRCLDYDIGTLYRVISDIVYGIFQKGIPNLDKLPRFNEVMQTFDSYLGQKHEKFLTDDQQITIADISIYFTLCLTLVIPETDISKYENINALYKRLDDYIKTLDKDGLLEKAQNNLVNYALTMMKENNN